MNAYPHYALILAGIIFGFVSLIHLLGLVNKTRAIVSENDSNGCKRHWVYLVANTSIWMFIASCSILQGDAMSLKLESAAFDNDNSIPIKYTCDGKNISPPLSWRDEPKNTKSFVLIMDDPDAPGGNWDHWIVFNIPQDFHEFSENLSSVPNGAQYGKNSWGKNTYVGPCPPNGEHRYNFKIYALDALLNLPVNADRIQIETAMQGHILADTKLIGRYKKQGTANAKP